jgi:hypothetical protein
LGNSLDAIVKGWKRWRRKQDGGLAAALHLLLFCRSRPPTSPALFDKKKDLDLATTRVDNFNSNSFSTFKMPFAQLVIGPPGAGKSTYCNGMHQFLGAIGRKCSVVNLDPANDKTSYPCALDVRDLVTLEEIMDEDHLGPNGATLYALEELEENYSWLEGGLKELGGSCHTPLMILHLI